MAYQRAKGGIQLKIGGYNVGSDGNAQYNTLLTETAVVPNPSFDNVEIDPQSAYLGGGFNVLITDWGGLEQDVEFNIPNNNQYIEPALLTSLLKSQSIAEGDFLLEELTPTAVFESSGKKSDFTYSKTAPSGPKNGDLWRDVGKPLQKYNGTTRKWVNTSIRSNVLVNFWINNSHIALDDSFQIISKATNPTDVTAKNLYIDTSDDNKVYLSNGSNYMARDLQFAKSFKLSTRQQPVVSALTTIDRQQYEQEGVVSNLQISATTGELAKMNLQLKGGIKTVTEKLPSEDNFSIPYPQNNKGYIYLSRSQHIEIGSQVLEISGVDFNMNVENTQVKSVKHNSFVCTNIKPTINIKANMTEQNENNFAELTTQKRDEINVYFDDSQKEVRMRINIPRAQISENSVSDEDGLFVVDKTFSCLANQGDDSFNLELYL